MKARANVDENLLVQIKVFAEDFTHLYNVSRLEGVVGLLRAI
jgi:hypothetical protein